MIAVVITGSGLNSLGRFARALGGRLGGIANC
jgi:hypothetical protein